MARLEVVAVDKRYGRVIAVHQATFTVEHGGFTALLGPSGCGKTTLLRIIAGFTQPDQGEVRVAGKEMTGVPPERRRMGVVFQSYALFPHLSVEDNIAYGLRVRHQPQATVRDRVAGALALVRLSGLERRKPAQLSGGQQQRVALARALVIEPDVLLLDEPLSALDRAIRVELQDELRRIQREVGITTLFVTHDQDEAFNLADQVIVMREGAIQQQGTPRELYVRPANPFVSTFLGAANIVAGVLEEGADGTRRLRHGDLIIPVMSRSAAPIGQAVQAVIRPEWLSLHAHPQGERPLWPGKVRSVRFAGPVSEVTVTVADLDLRVLALTANADYAPGDQVWLEIDRQDLPIYAREEERKAAHA
ncbi:MAG TPA: ABC transporter ATP-binding protein [Chloroflexota bacterium]|nr:ABC transporter ATP-binding protein [Chloroflexota bacterium]